MKKVSLRELRCEGVSHDPQITKQVMLRRGDLPHLTAFSRAILAPGQTARAHEHQDMFEVFYVEAGTGVMTIDNAPHPFERGVCVVIEPGERHEITNNGRDELVLLYFGVEG
jgi:quercetin dioxygenase-like cupin family protein